jgi:tetratricopeptide (TPR) repeat protein
MTDLEYINHFFSTSPTPDEKEAFERRVAADSSFADEVAFFLSAIQVAGEQRVTEKKNQFRDRYTNKQVHKRNAPAIKLWYGLAAAAITAGIIFGYILLTKPQPVNQLADQFVKENLKQISVTMGSGNKDSLQTGVELYNQGKLSQAAQWLEGLLNTDSRNVNAKKYAGIVYLRLHNYDKALVYFKQLENTPDLYANPGKFYRAIVLMERNSAGDAKAAKELLQQVVAENLEGTDTAKKWLKNYHY